MELENKNIIITGAGRGIGKHVALACAREGANLGLVARTIEELRAVAKEINEKSPDVKVSIKVADVVDYNTMESAFKEFNDDLGMFHGVVANAGTSWKSATHEMDPQKFRYILEVNVLGVFNTFKAAFPYFAADNKKDKARFIITGSAAYPNGMPKFAAYAASKYAVIGFQKSVALEYSGMNLNINTVTPMMVDTRLSRGRKAGDGNKPPSMMDPWDLEDCYVYLLSPASNRVSDRVVDPALFIKLKETISRIPAEERTDAKAAKAYLEENEPDLYKEAKKFKKIVEFLTR